MAINYKLIFIVLALCVSFESHALVKAVGLTNTIRTAVPGLTTRAKFLSTATGSVFTKVIDIGLASIGAVFSKRAFSPWAAGITVAIVAAGYLIDQNSGDILTSGASTDPLYLHGAGTSLPFATSPDISLADYKASLNPPIQTGISESWINVSGYQMVEIKYYPVGFPTTQFLRIWHPRPLIPYTTTEPAPIPGVQTVVSDTQLATDVLPLLSDAELFDAMIDPVTGLPDQAITELQDAATDIQTEEDLLTDTDPNNDPAVTTPTATIEEELLTDALSESQKEEEEQKDPCDDNPDRVGCLDTGTFPADVSVQSENIAFSVSQFSLSSNTSCPSPLTITLTKGYSIPFSFDNFCNFATMINPIVSAVGFLIATMIVAGSVRGDGV
ncbi:MAG: hypothetical protein HAW67_04740 [Endozoicomonadaceae bacterium]|nr:hypothetical protein [Endozoicomonadaceae bacterium]